jgi:hypothetical protein
MKYVHFLIAFVACFLPFQLVHAETIAAELEPISYHSAFLLSPGLTGLPNGQFVVISDPAGYCAQLASSTGISDLVYQGMQGGFHTCHSDSKNFNQNFSGISTCAPDGAHVNSSGVPLAGYSCNVYTCPSGYDGPKTIDGKANMCESKSCESGQKSTFTIHAGKWSICDNDTASCETGTANVPNPYCDGSCKYNLQEPLGAHSASGATFANPKPIYVDFSATGTGVSCSVRTDDTPGDPPSCANCDDSKCDYGYLAIPVSDGTYRCAKIGGDDPGGNDPGDDDKPGDNPGDKPGGDKPGGGGDDPGSDPGGGDPKPGGGTGGGTGGGDGSSTGSGQCALEPDSPMCRSGHVGPRGHFNDLQPHINEAQDELTGEINKIKDSLSSLFGTLSEGGGSLPCPPPAIAFGKQISFCINQYSDSLWIISVAVLLIASVLSAFIIFR